MVQMKYLVLLLLLSLPNLSIAEDANQGGDSDTWPVIPNAATLVSYDESDLDSDKETQQRFLTVHHIEGATNKLRTYIWPKEICQVVVFCDSMEAQQKVEQTLPPMASTVASDTVTTTEASATPGTPQNLHPGEKKIHLNGNEICKSDRLIYKAYESSIQKVARDGTLEPKYYLPSPLLEFSKNTASITIKVAADFDNVGVTINETTQSLEMKLIGDLVTLTSSPYCQVRFEMDGQDVAKFDTIDTKDPATLKAFRKNPVDLKIQPYSVYNLESTKTANLIDKSMSTAVMLKPKEGGVFPAVTQNMSLSKRATCYDFWNLPTYTRSTNKTDNLHITFNTYGIKHRENKTYASVLLDTKGQSTEFFGNCSWVKICLGDADACNVPKNVLELLFEYGMFIPTDSDNAHEFGAHHHDLRSIQLQFKKANLIGNKPVNLLMMNYGLAGLKQRSLISHPMLIDVDASSLNMITVVQAGLCNARLVNDWGMLDDNQSEPMKKAKQALSIKKCDVLLKNEKYRTPQP